MKTHPKPPDVAAIFARLLSELSVSANQLAAQLGTSHYCRIKAPRIAREMAAAGLA